MSVISEKLPILKNPLTGFFVIVLCASTLVNAWVFQEEVELPKAMAWFIGLGILLLIVGLSRSARLWVTSKFFVLVSGLYLVGLFLSLLLSLDKLNSIFGVYPRYTNSVIFCLSWLILIALFGLFDSKDKLSIVRVVAFLSGLISLWGVAQIFGFGYYGGVYEGVRAAVPSFLGNPNFASMFVVTSIPLVIWLMSKNYSTKVFYYYFGVLALNLVGLMVFNSRGALLALAVAMVFSIGSLIYNKSYKVLAWVMLLFVSGIIAIWSFYTVTRVNIISTQLVSTDQSTTNRWLVWEVAFDEIITHPIAGSGLGNFFLVFRSSTHPAFTNTEWFDDAHNVMLHIFASAGVPFGSAILLLMGGAVFVSFRKQLLQQDLLAGAIGISIITWLVVGSFTPVTLPNWILLGVLIGIGLGYGAQGINFSLGFKSKVALTLVGLVFVVVGICFLLSEVFLWRSTLAQNRNEYALSEKLGNLSVKFFPYNLNATLNVQKALIEQGKYEQVDKHFTRFQQLHPLSSGIYQSMADYYVQMYQKTQNEVYKTKAIAAITSMIGYNSNYEPLLRVATLNLMQLEEFELATGYAKKALVYDGENYNGWMFLAQAEYQLDNKADTIFALEKAFQINPSRRFKEVLDSMRQSQSIKSVPFPYDL